VVEGARVLCAHSLEIVIVAWLLAVEAGVVDDPRFWGWRWDEDVEAVVVFI
jgi:hypothetical protein